MQFPDLLLVFFIFLKKKLCQWLRNTSDVQSLPVVELVNESETTSNDLTTRRGDVAEPTIYVDRSANAMCACNRVLDKTTSSRIIGDTGILEEIRSLSQRLQSIEHKFTAQHE